MYKSDPQREGPSIEEISGWLRMSDEARKRREKKRRRLIAWLMALAGLMALGAVIGWRIG